MPVAVHVEQAVAPIPPPFGGGKRRPHVFLVQLHGVIFPTYEK